MDKNLQIPGLYIIRFQTAPSVPAPFSHYDTFKLFIDSEKKINVDFSIHYIDRDELSEDEILDEGFSMDDNYSWKGAVPAIWIKEFQEILSSSHIIRKREEKEFEDFVEVELEEDGKRVTIYPVDKERWAYYVQEFMQAIFEISGRENPFELTYLDLDGGGETTVFLKASFAEKTFTMTKNKGAAQNLDWKQLQYVMDTVYRAGFMEELALEKRPSKRGKYLSAGDGLWYELGVAVVETTAKSKDLAKIESMFSSFVK
jgi:hypothetical protein